MDYYLTHAEQRAAFKALTRAVVALAVVLGGNVVVLVRSARSTSSQIRELSLADAHEDRVLGARIDSLQREVSDLAASCRGATWFVPKGAAMLMKEGSPWGIVYQQPKIKVRRMHGTTLEASERVEVLAPGPSRWANPEPFVGRYYTTYDGKRRQPMYVAQVRRDWLRWLKWLWATGRVDPANWDPALACSGFDFGPTTCERWDGSVRDLGPQELFLHANGPYLAVNLGLIARGYQTSFSAFESVCSCFPGDDVAPTVTAAAVGVTGIPVVTWTHPRQSQFIYGYVYCCVGRRVGSPLARQQLLLVGGGNIPPYNPFRNLRVGQAALVGVKLGGAYGKSTFMGLFGTYVQ